MKIQAPLKVKNFLRPLHKNTNKNIICRGYKKSKPIKNGRHKRASMRDMKNTSTLKIEDYGRQIIMCYVKNVSLLRAE